MPTRIICASLALCLIAGCNVKEHVNFNQAIVAANQKLAAAGEKFGKSVGDVLQNKADPKVLQSEFEQTRKLVADLQAEMQALKVPNDSTSKELFDAHQKFLAGQQRTIDNEMAQIVKIATDPKLPMFQKATSIQKLAEAMDRNEKKDLDYLQQVQRKFASEHHIKLK